MRYKSVRAIVFCTLCTHLYTPTQRHVNILTNVYSPAEPRVFFYNCLCYAMGGRIVVSIGQAQRQTPMCVIHILR